MKFRKKLYISFLLIFGVFIIFGFITIWQTRNMADNYGRMKKYDINAIKRVEAISKSLSRIRDFEAELLNATGETVILRDAGAIKELFIRIKKHIPAYKNVAEDEEKAALIEQLDALCDRFIKFDDQLIAEVRASKKTDAELQAMFSEFRNEYDAMQRVVDDLKEREFRNLLTKTESNITFFENIFFDRIMVFISLTVIGFLIAFYFSEKFSASFDQVEERLGIEKLKTHLFGMLVDKGEAVDYTKLLYMISNGISVYFMSVFIAPINGGAIGAYKRIDSFSELDALSNVDGGLWSIEYFPVLFSHAENVKGPVVYETVRLFDRADDDTYKYTAEQKRFVGYLKSREIKTVLIYPVFKDSKLVKYYVMYFRDGAEAVSGTKLNFVSELLRETELVIDNMDLLKQLREKNEQLKVQNIEMSAYASTVSHDLKNPLSAVSGFYQLLAGKLETIRGCGADDEVHEMRDYVQKGLGASRMMANLIDDILEFSRVKDSYMKCEHFDTGELISSVRKFVEPQLAKTGIEFEAPRNAPEICADKNALQRVFMNLISNSIKYIGAGENKKIFVTCQERPGEYVFAVSDNGAGMSKVHHANLFTPFYRTKEHSGIEGTGLGLAITKKIIEKHGGRIWFESSPGSGTTFWFTIPRNASSSAETEA